MSTRQAWTLRQFKDDPRGEWRWSLIAPNGRSTAVAGEGYHNRKHCAKMCGLLFPWIDPVTGKGVPPARAYNETINR